MTQALLPFDIAQRMSWLIHGRAKRGKSTLAATAPKPALVLDAEGSWRFIPARIIFWDPMTSTPPMSPGGACQHLPTEPHVDGCWDVCVVHVTEWQTVLVVYQYLTQWTMLPFVSVVLDSITEIQRRCRANLKGTEAMKIQDWGVLLAQMDDIIRKYRDLCLIKQISVRCVVFVAETKEGSLGRLVPSMQGQISTGLPYWVDVCGYLYEDYEVDANGQMTAELRRLWIAPHQQYEAGERVQGKLGSYLTIMKPCDGCVGTEIEYWMRYLFNLLPSANGNTPAVEAAQPQGSTLVQ